MTRTGIAIFIVGTFLVLGAGFALAQDEGPMRGNCEARFNVIDANHDGQITHEEFVGEFQRRAEKMWKTRDPAGKGTLTKDEFCNPPQRRGRRMMQGTTGQPGGAGGKQPATSGNQ